MKKMNKRKSILKIFAVIFSFVIWFYVLSSTSVILNKDVKINYIVPKGYSLASEVPSKLLYKLKGPRAIINELINREEIIDIDLSKNFSKSNRRYSLSYLRFTKTFSFGVKTLNISPKSIQVYLVKNSIRKIPIDLNTIYSTSDDLVLDKIELSQKSIKVYGAKNVLSKIESIQTAPLDLSALTTNKEIELKLLLPDVRLSTLKDSVLANIYIKKNIKKLQLTDIPISFNSKNPVISSSDKVVDLLVSIDQKMDKDTLMNNIVVEAKVTNTSKKEHIVNLDINLPKGVHLIESSVNKVKIKTGLNND